jgi:putative serine protease PepD
MVRPPGGGSLRALGPKTTVARIGGGGAKRSASALVRLKSVEPEEGMEEEGPYLPWLPPDDRLWRHPSERPVSQEPSRTESDKGGGDGGGGGRRSPRHRAGWGRAPSARLWVIAVVAAVVGAVAASGVGMVSGAFDQQTTVLPSVMPSSPTVTLASDSSNGVDWSTVEDAVGPSVVGIQVSTASGPATGSGVLFEPGDRDCYVLTDSALVAGASGIQVSLATTGQIYKGQVVGSDPMSGLALIAVAVPPLYQDILPLGSAADLHLATPVLAVGAPANASASIFSGLVAAEDREVDLTGGSAMENLISVSGSSILPDPEAGGPLVDQFGRIIGITVSLDPTNSGDQNVLFAVPVDVAWHVTQQLLSGARVTHPWLGVIDTEDLTSAEADQYGLSGGAQIGQVSPGSPASRMGLQPNDIITSINGTPVTSSGTLTQLLFTQGAPGRPLTVGYVHNGKPTQRVAYLTEQPTGD